MSVWLDKKYINLVSSQLPRFKWKTNNLGNCRCVVCGDSQTSKIKARGYLFPAQKNYVYKCHDCGVALPFANLLQRVSRSLYDEYMMETFKESAPQTTPDICKTTAPPTRGIFLHPEMHQLSSDLDDAIVPVRDFILNRKLPTSALTHLYGTVEAHSFIKQFVDEKRSLRVKDGVTYLVIPLRDTQGMWFGAQFRTITQKEYVTFRWGHETLRCFGLNRVKLTQPTVICEGPLDAVCLPNAIAACGSDILGAYDRIIEAGLSFTTMPTLIWDNEPRNKSIVNFVRMAIERHFPVVIWSENLPKDLNEMHAAGLNVSELVRTHTYQGLRAELEYQRWHKGTRR